MLHKIIIIFLLSIKLICSCQGLSAQSFYTIEKPESSGEEIILETDRQFYCSDEKIFFTARYTFDHPMEDTHWSNVIYVELIRWNGEKIAQGKYLLKENSASGTLAIPGNLLSGNYYLRAYTKWMRNFTREEYFYKPIKVVNPYESKTDTGPSGEGDNTTEQLKTAKSSSYNGIECLSNKSIYKQREKVELSFRFRDPEIDASKFCLSVVKAPGIDTNRYFVQLAEELSQEAKSLSYLPETRGITISGKVSSDNSPLSLAQTTVHLSTPQNWKYFTTFQTKEQGLFYFTLPDFYGEYDFYLDAVMENGESAKVSLDNDYCTRAIQLEYIAFSLDSAERAIALEMAVNMQLSGMYDEGENTPSLDSAQLPFYVNPTQVYYTRDYVQLPNLEEFFYELVKEVRTSRINKQTSLKLAAYSQYQDLQPLVLMDNIPVSDLDEFLKTPLEKIEKIEIIDEAYIVSSKMYSGIICVYTEKKDFAGIELRKNSQFFRYNVLSGGKFKKADFAAIHSTRQAYMQNVLFWDADIELKKDQSNTLSFYTSDSKGEYIVYLRSTDTDATSQVYGRCKIVVD